MDRTYDAWTGAMTDVMHNVWMGCMDDAWTGATTDVSHSTNYRQVVILLGFHAVKYCIILPIITGDF